MDVVTYKTVAGHEIRADVHTPQGGTGGPAVLMLHGGGLIMGNRAWISPVLLRRCAEAGFTVISIDYRLAPVTKLAEIVADVEDAWAWLRARAATEFAFDPDRVAVLGHSAGGYLALLAGARFRPRPRAVVALYGYGELTGAWYAEPSPFYNRRERVSEEAARAAVGSSTVSADPMSAEPGRGEFYLYCRQQGTWPQEVAGHPASDRGWFAPYEPLHNVSAAFPPTLLLHGEADTDVPFEQSARMAEELARHGVAHELLSDPAWDHGFDIRADEPAVRKALDRVVPFLAEFTS